MAGTVSGIYGANEPWNAASTPFWGRFNEVEVGSLGSQRVTEMHLDKVTGHIYVSTSNASIASALLPSSNASTWESFYILLLRICLRLQRWFVPNEQGSAFFIDGGCGWYSVYVG